MNETLKHRVFLKPENKMIYSADRTLELNLSREILKIDGTCYYFDSEDIVIMKCTGLRDKNGTWIYEGDIVTDDALNYQVKHFPYDGFVKIPIGQSDYYFSGLRNIEFYEIIGNIYDNSDLLKGGGGE